MTFVGTVIPTGLFLLSINFLYGFRKLKERPEKLGMAR
jgi:hypothetical protein